MTTPNIPPGFQAFDADFARTLKRELFALREQLESVTKERDEARKERDQWRECAVELRAALLAAVARLGNALSMTTGKAVEGPVPGALDTLTKVTESLALFDKLEGGVL